MSTKYNDINKAIASRFDALITVAESLQDKVEHDNAEFTKPDEALWVRFTIKHGESVQLSFGSTKRFRFPGVAIAQVFMPQQKGDAEAVIMADKIATAFRSVTAAGVTYRTPSVMNIGRVANEYQVNVTCPFYSDEIV